MAEANILLKTEIELDFKKYDANIRRIKNMNREELISKLLVTAQALTLVTAITRGSIGIDEVEVEAEAVEEKEVEVEYEMAVPLSGIDSARRPELEKLGFIRRVGPEIIPGEVYTLNNEAYFVLEECNGNWKVWSCGAKRIEMANFIHPGWELKRTDLETQLFFEMPVKTK